MAICSRRRARVDKPESTILVPLETSQSSTNLQLAGSSRFQRSMALAGIATTGQLRRNTVSTSFLRSVGLVWSFLSSSSSAIVILIVSFARWTNAMGRRRGTADYQEADEMTGLVVVGRRRWREESRARPWMERCHLRQRLEPDGWRRRVDESSRGSTLRAGSAGWTALAVFSWRVRLAGTACSIC